MLFKIGTKNSLTKTAYISRRKQSIPPTPYRASCKFYRK